MKCLRCSLGYYHILISTMTCLFHALTGIQRRIVYVTDGSLSSFVMIKLLCQMVKNTGLFFSILVRGKNPGKCAHILKLFVHSLNYENYPPIYVESSNTKHEIEKIYDKLFYIENPCSLFEGWKSKYWGLHDLIIHHSSRKHLKKISTHPLMGGRNIVFQADPKKKYDFLFGKFLNAFGIEGSRITINHVDRPDIFFNSIIFNKYMVLSKERVTHTHLGLITSLLFPSAPIEKSSFCLGKRTVLISDQKDPELFWNSHKIILADLLFTIKKAPEIEYETYEESYTLYSVRSDYYD